MAVGAAAHIVLLLLCASATQQDQALESSNTNNDKDFVHLYEEGKQAYLDEHWQRCIDLMRSAVDAYKTYRMAKIRCRTECRRAADAAEMLTVPSVEDLDFYERQVRATLCLLKCGKKDKTVAVTYSRTQLDNFERLMPYDYMQLCYFQVYLVYTAPKI
jgi:hypothetical protein